LPWPVVRPDAIINVKFESLFKCFDESRVNASSANSGRDALLTTQMPVVAGFLHYGDVALTFALGVALTNWRTAVLLTARADRTARRAPADR
jgi:hypothetical protein